MSSSVCQGLQSCLEPLIIQPRVSKLKWATPKPNFSRPLEPSRRHDLPHSSLKDPENNHLYEENNNNNNKGVDDGDIQGHNNGELGSWDFIQALTDTSYIPKEVFDSEKAFVHPLMKRSSSTILSGKSLEMCTESIGSETGNYTSKTDDEIPSLYAKKFAVTEPSKTGEIEMIKKLNRSRSLPPPPPLSSISSLDCVQVRPHREGGRLVIRAVSVNTCRTYFHAERGDGRLKLRFLKDCFLNSNKEDGEDEDEEVSGEFEDIESEGGGHYEDGDGEPVYLCEDMEGNSGNVEGEIGMGKLQRPTRCLEGGNRILNWDSLWVAS